MPSKTIADLAIEIKANFQVKKLSGAVMFKLILFSMPESGKLSLIQWKNISNRQNSNRWLHSTFYMVSIIQ